MAMTPRLTPMPTPAFAPVDRPVDFLPVALLAVSSSTELTEMTAALLQSPLVPR
ncbi:uncharacterized protein TrAtP1_002444 [Trichoderma atroviride]|uniref:uncharacterized protein n=1 Tax=Hypocrea atroviridis TaxID=63577 RepID=UPI00332642A4|nr:hypothetical protein TrAtP1_002444 [Trichoderma atroviride]